MHLLILYTTTACRLCEQAEKLLVKTLDFAIFECNQVDIISSNELLERYGVRIPVLVCGKSGQELNWPFNSSELHGFAQRVVALAP
mgnify:CR=1 FL=1